MMPDLLGVDPARAASEGFKLVKQASDAYRRAGARLERARKALAKADREFSDAKRALKLAIDAVQPVLPEVAGDEKGEL
jgi:hypothetical protein